MRRKDKSPMPLILVILPKLEKHIYHLIKIANVVITTESHQKAIISQCFKCQTFGHDQSRCTASPKCVFCTGSHQTCECGKNKLERNAATVVKFTPLPVKVVKGVQNQNVNQIQLKNITIPDQNVHDDNYSTVEDDMSTTQEPNHQESQYNVPTSNKFTYLNRMKRSLKSRQNKPKQPSQNRKTQGIHQRKLKHYHAPKGVQTIHKGHSEN